VNNEQHPLWVKEARDRRPLLDMLDIALKVTTVVYTGIVAWQTLKILCPPLAVQEQIALARIRQYLAKPAPRRVEVPQSWLRDLYDDTR